MFELHISQDLKIQRSNDLIREEKNYLVDFSKAPSFKFGRMSTRWRGKYFIFCSKCFGHLFWCDSLPSQTVMIILNPLSWKIVEFFHKYPVLTKIKIIDDCYESVDRLFSEKNDAVSLELSSVQILGFLLLF